MTWYIQKLRKKAYHCIGWSARDFEAGIFRVVRLPDRSTMRVMDKGVHLAALESAGEKLVELERRSGRKIQ